MAGHAVLGMGIPVGVPVYRPSGMIAGNHAWPTDVVSATSAYRSGEPAWSEMALATPGGSTAIEASGVASSHSFWMLAARCCV